MMTLSETFKNYIAEQQKSDSGDPLITGIIIMGVLAVAAIAIISAIANSAGQRGSDVSDTIQDSGDAGLKNTGNVKFSNF